MSLDQQPGDQLVKERNGPQERERERDRDRDHPDNIPPYSRIFIVCSKTLTEEDLVEYFKAFGNIEYCLALRDKSTGEMKGLAYIKYDKASSAALAIEEANGKQISEDTLPFKVMIANAKSSSAHHHPNQHQHTNQQQQQHHHHHHHNSNRPQSDHRSGSRDTASKEPEDLPPRSRLFVICAKELTEEDLIDNFKAYGDFEYCKIMTDRNSHESKGFAYIKFSRASTACIAMEDINERGEIAGYKVKALIADPKSRRTPADHNKNTDFDKMQSQIGRYQVQYSPTPMGYTQSSEIAPYPLFYPLPKQRLFIVCHKSITQEQLARIFARYSGMEYCDLKVNKQTGESRGFAYVNYSTPQAALMAKEQLDGIEFPQGCLLKVMFAEPLGVKDNQNTNVSENQPLSPNDRNYPEGSRLFLVLSKPLPEYVLQELFGRIAGLEYVRLQKDKNYGYVKYTSPTAAQYALQYLHASEYLGVKIKLQIAIPPNHDPRNQRQRNEN